MLRVLHTADIHLGARHTDLGEQATAQRERQFEAFGRTIDLAISEKVDLFLVAGDLFDSNAQPRRTVERVGAQLGRLAAARIRAVLLPGLDDRYDRASVYRAHDLVALAGLAQGSELLTILTPDVPEIVFPDLDAIVFGRVFDGRPASARPLDGFAVDADGRARWKIGLVHGSLATSGRTDRDEVALTKEEVATSGLDYLALGHEHAARRGTAAGVHFAYSGAPEAVAIERDAAGKVLLVTLDGAGGKRRVEIEERQVGRTRFERVELDAGSIASGSALVEELARRADPDLVLDVRLTGVRPDELELEVAEVEAALAPSFFRVRVRDGSVAELTDPRIAPADTILGAYVRDLEDRIGRSEADGKLDAAAELRDALRIGRLLLSGEEVAL